MLACAQPPPPLRKNRREFNKGIGDVCTQANRMLDLNFSPQQSTADCRIEPDKMLFFR